MMGYITSHTAILKKNGYGLYVTITQDQRAKKQHQLPQKLDYAFPYMLLLMKMMVNIHTSIF